MTVEGLHALGLHRFQLDLCHLDFFRGLLDDDAGRATRGGELRAALARKDTGTLERLVGGRGAPVRGRRGAPRAADAGRWRGRARSRRARSRATTRSARALENLAEVYRLLKIYGLGESVLLDLGEVRGFDYYSGLYFETYVSGFGASIARGGRYDHMLGPLRLRLPGGGLRLRRRPRAQRDGGAGRGSGAAGAGLLHHRLHAARRRRRCRSRAGCATAGRRSRATS